MRAIRTRFARPASWLGALVLALSMVALGPALPALAATPDTFDRFDVDYVVGTDGVAHVTETIVYRFGSDAGRHGLDRKLVTREPSGDQADKDVVFPVSNVKVTSPDPVSTQTQIEEFADQSNPRSLLTRIRIGSANRTITSDTVTYVITYDQRGLLRGPQAAFDEFHVDAIGPGVGLVRSATVTVTVPQGAQDVVCSAAPSGQKADCTSATITDGLAVFTAQPLQTNYVLSVDAKIVKGAAGTASRIYVDSTVAAEQRQTIWALIAGGIGAVLMPIFGWLYYRPRSRDDRFAGAPPGTFPPKGAKVGVEPNQLKDVPVSFAAPRLPLMYAGYLLEGTSKVQHLTATLIGLATAGAIQLFGSAPGDDRPPTAVPRDPKRSPDKPSRLLFDGLFGNDPSPVALDEAGSLESVRQALEDDTIEAARAQGWFKRGLSGVSLRGRAAPRLGGLLFAGFMLVSFIGTGGSWLWAIIPIVTSAAITIAIVATKLVRGQRTAVGRAWTDQIEGFRTYIATAEAEQLRFEEGEDIFTKYLPWAVLFGLAERWTKVCEQAVALGRMATPDTYWYGGGPWNPNVVLWNVNSWNDSLSTSSVPQVSDSSFGGTGFGGGSGFGGGGGFSGGGSGGGGASGW